MEPFSIRRRVSRLMFLTAVMHATVTKRMLASSSYKSQRKNRTREGEKRNERGEVTVRKHRRRDR
jgi:hypothetical protein